MEINLPTSITKRILGKYVNRKLNFLIHHSHVFSVISILFDEIIKDLKQGKEINIYNFGILSLKKTKPRLHFDIKRQQVILSKGYKILKFTLARKINRILRQHLDVQETFKDDTR